jgi:large subunit ribosomal protein L14e
MVTLNVGRVCMKICGRESGKYAVVIKKLKDEKTKSDAFVLITGPKLLTGVKRRKCNIVHLEPTQYSLEIKEDAQDEEVIEAYKKANLTTKLDFKLPSAAELKAEKAKPAKEEKKPEKKPKEEKKEEKPKDKKTKDKKK